MEESCHTAFLVLREETMPVEAEKWHEKKPIPVDELDLDVGCALVSLR